MKSIEAWTVAKSPDPRKNEDVFEQSDDTLALADGATDKTGILYPGNVSGGLRLASVAALTAIESKANGYDLADEVTKAVRAVYEKENPAALEDPSKRAASTLVVARFVANKLVLTQIGDTNIQVTLTDGTQYRMMNDKLIDEENARLRSDSINARLAAFKVANNREPVAEEMDSIVAGGRDSIAARLAVQYEIQNSTDDETYGYGAIDGTFIPRSYASGVLTEYVRVHEFDAKDVSSVELVTDGFYGEFPKAASAESYRQLYDRIHREDPNKYLKYLSVKPKDDATVVIAKH